MVIKPLRTPWENFPSVVIHAAETAVKRHASYAAAKSGDVDAAMTLVAHTIFARAVDTLRARLAGRAPMVLAVHAIEYASVNVIPQVMAGVLADRLGLRVATGVIQINRVGHTGSSGFHRLANPALFDGPVSAGADYLLVDDFVGQGGTLANLRGSVEHAGGHVIAATTLTGKPYSATLGLIPQTLAELRNKHGADIERWWREVFGYGFELLTESEARYLLRTETADVIRARVAAAAPGGSL